MTPRIALAAHLLISAVVVSGALILYDRLVVQPALVIGVVDLADVYRAKEDQFSKQLTAAHTEDDRQLALQMARAFSQRLPLELDRLPIECRCLVVLKASVVGPSTRTVDLTARLRHNLELP